MYDEVRTKLNFLLSKFLKSSFISHAKFQPLCIYLYYFWEDNMIMIVLFGNVIKEFSSMS